MIPATAFRIQSLCLLLLAAHWTAEAGEFVQLERATPAGNIVRVRDVAKVLGDDAEEVQTLLNLELCPTPPTLKTIVITRGELQQALALHGVSVRQWQWLGAEETLVVHRGAVPAAIQRAAAAEPIRGSKKPSQVSAEVAVKPAAQNTVMVVSATRPLTRGEIIKVSDVELIPVDPKAAVHGMFSVEEVIGKEATRNLMPGKALDKAHIQAQRLVKRDEEVKVMSRAPGVLVEVDAKALEDGAAGDVITVATLADKQKISARVVGWRRLDVFATSPQYPSDSSRSRTAGTANAAASRE
jgi:flagella basal body P-ring formation protein FlgA